jgi:Na+/melibiose symporter-like transporter
MLNVRFFENRRFTAANASITILFFALYGSMFLITQYLQTVLGYSPLEAGVRMLPMAAFMLTISPMAPRIVEKVGTKLVVGTGILLVAIGMVVVSSVPVANGYLRLLIGLAILSSGMGCVMAPATESIMGSLPPSKAGVGSAMNDTTRQMGGALGVAVIGSILASGYRPKVAAGLAKLGAPDSLIAAAKDSVGGAVDTARATVVEPLQSAAIGVARSEYVHAFAGAMRVAAVVVAVGAVIAFAFLPARAHDARESVEGPLDGIASLTFAEAEGVLEEDAAGLLGDGSELVGEDGGTAGPSVRGATGPRDPDRR